jgi:hypothetical protein
VDSKQLKDGEIMKEDFYFQHMLLKETKKIRQLLEDIYKKEIKMDTELQALVDQVALTVGIEQSAITLIQGIAAQLTALAEQLADEPAEAAQILQLRDSLNISAGELSAAVAANQPPVV